MFTHIKDTVAHVLRYLARGVDALEGILGTLPALLDAVRGWGPTASGVGEVSQDPRVTELLVRVDDLTVAVAEGIKNVSRSEQRVRSIVKGARRELAEAGFDHPGVEAEAAELELVDDRDSPEEQLPTVREDVAETGQVASSIPGVSAETLARARGR